MPLKGPTSWSQGLEYRVQGFLGTLNPKSQILSPTPHAVQGPYIVVIENQAVDWQMTGNSPEPDPAP